MKLLLLLLAKPIMASGLLVPFASPRLDVNGLHLINMRHCEEGKGYNKRCTSLPIEI